MSILTTTRPRRRRRTTKNTYRHRPYRIAPSTGTGYTESFILEVSANACAACWAEATGTAYTVTHVDADTGEELARWTVSPTNLASITERI